VVSFLRRGDIRHPGERMYPGAPPLGPGQPGEFPGADRLSEGGARAALARYLSDKDNPLTWRSIANRIWLWTFHQPLVDTPNDFGRMGGLPSHPELLDYLAARLRDDPGQSMKSLIRLLVTSKAYRRSSDHSEANAAKDAGNRFLWRFHRRRLTAEEYRDALLSVAGVLRSSGGGPGFRDFAIEKPEHSPHYLYDQKAPDDPDTRFRSIYRFVVRSQPQPLLTMLDAADPSLSVPRREESTTALQALAQWNNPFVASMASHLAERMEHEQPGDGSGQVESAFLLAIGRAPTPQERDVLLDYRNKHGPENFARVLFNLHAFVYVD
jgi:hypothetical protein